MAKDVAAFRLSDTEQDMLDAIGRYYGLEKRPETIRWMIRKEYFAVIPSAQRVLDQEAIIQELRDEVDRLKDKLKKEGEQ